MQRQEFSSNFFFQAEDGIRDGHVTGVQTCALPISFSPPRIPFNQSWTTAVFMGNTAKGEGRTANGGEKEIGRASCRERGENSVVEGWRKEKDDETRVDADQEVEERRISVTDTRVTE